MWSPAISRQLRSSNPGMGLPLAKGLVELMGGDYTTVPARYREGSPHAGPPLKIPQWHVVGEDDTLVPASYVEDAVAFAHRRGEAVELITVPAAGHFEIVSASSPAWPMVEATIDAALR